MTRRAFSAHRGGFTLVECCIVLAVAGILAGLALPGYQQHERRMGRLDAVQALSRLQNEQERYRASFGLYAADLQVLQGVQARSPQGRYAVSLSVHGANAYRARAQASGEQLKDSECAVLTLDVSDGFAHFGPRPACWGR